MRPSGRRAAKIAVVGSYGAGLTMDVPRFPIAGETTIAARYAAEAGGKGSNQAVAAARLGAECSLLTAVGSDSYADDAFALWREEGVDNAAVAVVPDQHTMVGFILVEPGGENRIVIAPGALAQLNGGHLQAFAEQITEADVLVVSMEIPIEVVVEAAQLGRRVGTTVLLNPAPAQPLPASIWSCIDVLTPNQSEARVILGLAPDDPRSDAAVLEEIARRTAASVVLTRGSDGAYLAQPDEPVTSIPPGRFGEVVDTTGAGDAFTAALAVALAERESLPDATRFAALAGAFAVTRHGVIPALPRTDDLRKGES